jgi:Integrase zinc binding domain
MATEAIANETSYDELKESFTTLLQDLQAKDTSIVKLKENIIASCLEDTEGLKPKWYIDYKGLLHYEEAVYMSNDQAIRQEIMKANHDDLYSSHFDIARTTKLICQKYFWPSITANIKEYVDSCNMYQRTKSP